MRESWPSPSLQEFLQLGCVIGGLVPMLQIDSPRIFTRALNKLLATIPDNEYDLLQQHLTLVPLALRQTLHKDGERIAHVYFPSGGACSITKTMQNGQTAE